MMDPNDQIPLDFNLAVNNSLDMNDGFDFLDIFDSSPAENELNHECYFNSDCQEIIEDLQNNALTSNNNNIQENENSGKEHSSLFAELSKENAKFKCVIKRLKKKIISRQRKMASYEIKLAQSMTDLAAANKELEEARKAKISYETENEKLNFQIQLLESEVKQYKGLKIRKDQENLKIKELEKEVSYKMRSIRKLKKYSATYRCQIAQKDTELKRRQHHIKHVLCILSEFGIKLTEHGLLTENFMMDIKKKFEALSLKTPKRKGGKNDFSEMVSAVFNNPLKLADNMDSDIFNICIEDPNDTSCMLSPISSLASNSEVEACSDSRSMEAFQTELDNSSKTKITSKRKLPDHINVEEDQNWNLCSSPESLNFDKEVLSCDNEEKQISISLPLPHHSCTNDKNNSCKVTDHSVSASIMQPLSKFEEKVFTDSQSVETTHNSDFMPVLGNFQSSSETDVTKVCQIENTSLSGQDFQSINRLQEISAEKCESFDTPPAEPHNLIKKKSKYTKKIYKNNSQDEDWNLCSSPESSNSGNEVHPYDKEETVISPPLHDSFVNDAKKSEKLKCCSVFNCIDEPLSKINEQVFAVSQSFEVTPCSDTDPTNIKPALSMPALWNSQICSETNMSVPGLEESHLKNDLSKQDSHSIPLMQEMISTEKFSGFNQKIFEHELKSSKNSNDPIAMDNNFQADGETDSSDDSDLLEIEDIQSDSFPEGDKDFLKTLNDTSSPLSNNLVTQEICLENPDSVCMDNQNINLSVLSSLVSFPPRNEVTSSNNSSTMSFQNEPIGNFSTEQERSEKKLSAPSFSHDSEQDRFYEFPSESITSEKNKRSPEKLPTVRSILQKQNSNANKEKKLCKMKEVSSSNNISMSTSSLKNPIIMTNEEIEEAFSGDALSDEGSLSTVSMSLLENVPVEEHNFCPTPEIELKNKALLELSLAINESNISNVPINRTVLRNKISNCDLSNNLIIASEFEKNITVFQDEFSEFDNLLNMLLNPLSPLPPSPRKNSRFFQDENILNGNLKEPRENLQANQISISKLVKDQELLIDEDQNSSCEWKGDLLPARTSFSHKNDCFTIESHYNVTIDTQPKFVELCSSVNQNGMKSQVSEKQNVTSDVLYPKVRPCFVSLSKYDVPRYFASVRKQSSSQMFTIPQSNCESFIPENLNLISSPEMYDLLLNNDKVAINANNILEYNLSQNKTELKSSNPPQKFSENKSESEFHLGASIMKPFIDSKTKVISSLSSSLSVNASPNSLMKDSPVVAHDCSLGDSIHDLSESENSPLSSHSSKYTLKFSISNGTKSSSNQKQILNRTSVNIQNPCVLLSKNDVSNYFLSLEKQSSFQGNKCNQTKVDCSNARVCRNDILFSNKQLEKLETHNNLSTSVPTNCRTMSDSGYIGNETAYIKKSLLGTQFFSDNESNINPGHEITTEKSFGLLNVKNASSPFSPMALTKSLNSYKQQPSSYNINAAEDHDAYSELENCYETNTLKFITGETSLNMIKSSTSREQNISNRTLTSKTKKCHVSLSKSDVPNYFQNLRNKTPSQIVDYYYSHLTNSASKNSDCTASAEIKLGFNDMQYKPETISNLSASEIFFEKEPNSKLSHDGLLEETSILSKTKITVPSLSFQPVPPSPNLVEDSSLNTGLDPSGFDRNVSATEQKMCYKLPNKRGNISEDKTPSNVMASSAKEQEIADKLLPGNIRKCSVSLSRSDVSNYFLSLRKKSVSKTTELNQTGFTNLKSNVPIFNRREQTASSISNDNFSFIDTDCEMNIECDSIHHKVKEVGINSFFIASNKKDESNSFLNQEILSHKSNLMRERADILPDKIEKLVSYFNIIQNPNENSLKSQSLHTMKTYSPPSVHDVSGRVIQMNKKLNVPISQNSSSSEICHGDFSTETVKLPINYLEENSSKSSRFQNCSGNIVNSIIQNTFKPSISRNSFLKVNNGPPYDVGNNTDRVELVYKKLTAPSSQNSSDTDMFPDELAEIPVVTKNRLNQNSFNSAMSDDCSANPLKPPINQVDENASKPSRFQNTFLMETHASSLDANDIANKVEPVNKKMTVPPFQKSSDTERFHGDLSADFLELPVEIQHQKYPVKRKGPVSSDCNFSENTSLKKRFSNFTLSEPLDKEKRTTILLPAPSMSTKWKKSSIINRPSVPNKQERVQPEMPITSGFQKSYSSNFKRRHTSIDSLKKTIKPIDIQMTCAAPVRVRGRTSKSKVFFKGSCSELVNNNVNSNCDVNKLAESDLMSHEHDEKIENYISVKPQKIRKQHEKISGNNKETADTLLTNALSRKGMNFISFVKGKDLKDESIELCSSKKSPPNANNCDFVENNNRKMININNKIKCDYTKSECITSKKRPLNSDIESVMKKQNCNGNSENSLANSSISKNISVNDNSLSKTIEDDQHSENYFDGELVIVESDNEKSGTCDNSVDEHFEKTTEKLLNVKSSCPALLEESYNFDMNSCNANFKDIVPSDINELKGNKFLFPSNELNVTEMLSLNNSESLFYEIPSKSIVSNIGVSSSLTNCANQNTLSLTTATSKIVATTNSHKNETSITIPGASKINKTSNSQCKSNGVYRFSKEGAKNDKKKIFINKGNQKSHRTKFMEKKTCKSSKNKAAFPLSVHFGGILDGMNDYESVDGSVFKRYVHSLTNFLINPKNAPDTATLIFHVVQHLHLKQENSLLKFLESPESYPVILPSEACVITALLDIEKKNKYHLQGLVNSLLSVMYNVIIEKKKLNIFGMSSLCRVFTELCKQKGNKQKALFLCCELSKQKKRSPILVASIVGVWNKLFEIHDNFPDEKVILFSAIAYGAQKRPKKLKKSTWENISKLLAKYFVVPIVPNAKKLIEFLKERIVSNSLKGLFENSWYLTASLVILAAHEPWDWTKQTLLNDYIVTNLKRFASQDFNEKAFDFFCDLYVDVNLLAPTKFADTELIKFVEDKVECKEKFYVRSCAAAALMKYVILAKREVPPSLTVFFKNNSEHPKVKLLADVVQRRTLSTCVDKLSIDDVMICT